MIGKDITFKDQYGNIKEGIVVDDSIVDSVQVKYFEPTLNMGWM